MIYFPDQTFVCHWRAAWTFTATATPPSALDLGRFRQGDTLKLLFVLPNQSAPVSATIQGPAGSETLPLSTRDGLTFLARRLLDQSYPPGIYRVLVQAQALQFEVVPGGDPGGSVMSLFHSKSVQGWQVLAQLQSGQLVLGRNPRT